MRLLRPLLLLLFFVSATALYSQGQPPEFLLSPKPPAESVIDALIAEPTRELISLNGTWQVSYDEGENWYPVTVPSSWLGAGKLLYRRTFRLSQALRDRYRWKLISYGVQYSGVISLNDQFLVQRESLIPFAWQVPEELTLKDQNTIVVEVDNQLSFGTTLPGRKLLFDARTYGGIVRDMFLVGVPRVWIDDALYVGGSDPKLVVRVVAESMKGLSVGASSDTGTTARTIDADGGTFSLMASARRTTRDTGSIVVGDLSIGEKSVEIRSKRTATVELPIDNAGFASWRPDDPTGYLATVQLRYQGSLVDQLTVPISFRRLSPEGGGLLLNDTLLNVKGVVYIEDTKAYGASMPYGRMREDIRAIRDMGANLIRFPNGPPHPYLLRLCEQNGILAFIDIPVGSPPPLSFGDEEFLERAISRANHVIEASRGFSSVVGFGFGSVIPVGAAGTDVLLGNVRRSIDSLAPGRLLYAGLSDWNNPDYLRFIDIAGLIQFDGTTEQALREVALAVNALQGKKPILFLNYGKLIEIENRNGYSDPLSVQAQAKFITDMNQVISKTGITGGIYWAFNDYRTDRPLLTVNNFDQYIASCGLYTLEREARIAAQTLAAIYTDQQAPDVAIGEYNPPSTLLFIAFGIACAVTFLLLINNSRRFRENVFRALLRPYNFYADIRDQRILSTIQTTVLGLVIAATVAVILVSLCYYYRMNETFDYVLGALIASNSIKEGLNFLIWRPLLAIGAFTVLFFLKLVIASLLIQVCSVFVRNRIFFADAYTIAVWGALPVLLLIPIAMVLYRLLDVPSAGIIAFTIMIAVLIWILYRILRGTAVIYDVSGAKVYGYALGGIIIILAIALVTSDTASAMIGYLSATVGDIYTGG